MGVLLVRHPNFATEHKYRFPCDLIRDPHPLLIPMHQLLHLDDELKSRESPKTKDKELHLVTGLSGFSKTLPPRTELLRRWTFGDDAYFIARNKVADVIGIADGVGGWRSYGIDPSAFPHSLMSTCERMVRESRFHPQTPANIIADSYYELLEQKLPLIGSSTACIVALHREEHTVYAANLGDSGFLIIRNDEVVHRSQEQQHYFNTPFQLAVPPPMQQGLVINDSPDMAESSSFGVEEGDVILLGTDGLFDNMNEEMLLDYVSRLRDHKEDNVQKAASNIAEKAHQLAFDPDYLSPFALSAIDAGIELRGGKPDDITVIVAKVTNLTDTGNGELA